MKDKNTSEAIVRGFVIVASAVIIIAGLKAAQEIVAPFLVSIFLALTLSPLVLLMTRRRVPKIIAVMIVMLGLLIIGAGVALLVGTSVDLFTQNLPTYQERLRSETASLRDVALRLGLKIPKEGLIGLFEAGAALSFAAVLLTEFANLLANAFLILLTAVFILLELSEFPGRVRRAIGSPNADFGWFGKFTEDLRRYLAIKTVVGLAEALAIGIWLWIIGVDFPFLWALLAFLLNYIPNIGSIIAAVPPLLLTVLQLGWGSSFVVALGFLAVNLVFGNLVEPRVLGRGLGLSTLVVFLSLLFWGWVLGPVGLFLSVPLTMTVIIALKSKPETKWIAVVLGTGDAEQAGLP